MNSTLSFSRGLRRIALAVLLTGVGLWGLTGARIGWTQTTAVTLQRDEITGIDYPVRHAAFIAGVEIPLLAAALAASLTVASFLRQRVPATVSRHRLTSS